MPCSRQILQPIKCVQDIVCWVLVLSVLCCQDRIDAIVQQAERFVAANHFDSEAIVSKQQALVERYENLQVRVLKLPELNSIGGSSRVRWLSAKPS